MSSALPLRKRQEPFQKLYIIWDLLEGLKQTRTQGWKFSILVINNSKKNEIALKKNDNTCSCLPGA